MLELSVLIFNISWCVIGCIKALILRLLSFQLFLVDEKLSVFVLRASILECISSLGLDGRADMQPVKSAWLVLHGELKAGVLTPL